MRRADRDRNGGGARTQGLRSPWRSATYHSGLLPPCVKRVRSIRQLIAGGMFKGDPTANYQEPFSVLRGDSAKALLANTISRLKPQKFVRLMIYTRSPARLAQAA